MSYVIVWAVSALAGYYGLTALDRRRRKVRADMAEAEANIAAWRAAA